MAKKFKLKYLIIIMIAIAVITSCTAFSVSYASWVGNTNNTLSANGSIGNWDNNSGFGELGGIDFTNTDGTNGKMSFTNETLVSDKSGKGLTFVLHVIAEQEISVTIYKDIIDFSKFLITIYDETSTEAGNKEYNNITDNPLINYDALTKKIKFKKDGYFMFILDMSNNSSNIDKIPSDLSGVKTIDLTKSN